MNIFHLNRREACTEHEIKQFLRFSCIPRYHCAESILHNAFLVGQIRWPSRVERTAESVNTIWSVPVVLRMRSLTLCSTRLLRRSARNLKWLSLKHDLCKLGSVGIPFCHTSPSPLTSEPISFAIPSGLFRSVVTTSLHCVFKRTSIMRRRVACVSFLLKMDLPFELLLPYMDVDMPK